MGRGLDPFFAELEAIVLGPAIAGVSGFVDLRERKARYFGDAVRPAVEGAIESALGAATAWSEDPRGEICRELLAFARRQCNQSGSLALCGSDDLAHGDDIQLTWATRGSWYVKRDRLFASLAVEVGQTRFHFDASGLAHRTATEKRTLLYAFKGVSDGGRLEFAVTSTEGVNPIPLADLGHAVRQAGVLVDDSTVERALGRFARQAEVEYFVCPDPRPILDQRLDRWLAGMLCDAHGRWTPERLAWLEAFRQVGRALNLTLSRFEEDLARIWSRPKAVLRASYVLTLDRLAERDLGIIDRLVDHESWPKQQEEWRQLGFNVPSGAAGRPLGGSGAERSLMAGWCCLPLDTRYFPDLQADIVALFDDLDATLDGWLVKSDNFQALTTLARKFQGEVQTCYIDPPYNTAEDSFSYVDRLTSSTWLTMLENRLGLARDLLRSDGTIFVQVDFHETATLKLLMDQVFGPENLLNEIVWRIGWVSGFKTRGRRFVRNHETIWGYAKGPNYVFDKDPLAVPRGRLTFDREDERALQALLAKAAGGRMAEHKAIVRTADGRPLLHPLPTRDGSQPAPYALEDVWNANEYDELNSIKIMSFSSEKMGDDQDRNSTQKPERLVARLIASASRPGDLVLDFFCGTATTLAAAHKLGRRWIGVELSEGAYNKARDRMKTVLAGTSKKGASRLGKRFGEPCGISRESGWKGGGIFKCFELESYDQALRGAVLDLEDPDVDLPETLSCLLGKKLKRVRQGVVEFADGSQLSPRDLDPGFVARLRGPEGFQKD